MSHKLQKALYGHYADDHTRFSCKMIKFKDSDGGAVMVYNSILPVCYLFVTYSHFFIDIS